MVKCISLGEVNKSLLYIVLMSVSLVINQYIYGFTYIQCFYQMNIYKTFYLLIIDSEEKNENKFIRHRVFDPLFSYFGIIILSFFFIKKKIVEEFDNIPKLGEINNSDNNSDNSNNNRKSKKTLKLIYNKNKQYFYNLKGILFYIFILFLWVAEENLILIYVDIFQDLDFWFFELIFVSIIFAKNFVYKISSHQKLGMAISILVGSILKIYNISITFTAGPSTYYVENPRIIAVSLLYFLLIILRSYVHTKIKSFLDLKYISHRFLLISYGIAGTIICIFTGIFTSKVSCPKDNSFYEQVCKMKDAQNELYYDNWDSYYISGKNMLVRLIIIVFGLLTYFANKYYMTLIIKNYTPIHVIFSFPIQFFIEKTFLLIFSAIFFRDELFKKSNHVKKFLLDESGDIGSILGFLIYLEIIELNFCGFNFNLKKNIVERSKSDYMESVISQMIPLQDNFDDDSDDDDENSNENSNDNSNDNSNGNNIINDDESSTDKNNTINNA